MKTTGYRARLQERGLAQPSADTYISDAKRVEHHYGDLDELYAEDGLAGVVQELQYSADDARKNAPNIPLRGDLRNGLASCRSTVRRYHEYRETDVDPADPNLAVPGEDAGRARLIGLERAAGHTP